MGVNSGGVLASGEISAMSSRISLVGKDLLIGFVFGVVIVGFFGVALWSMQQAGVIRPIGQSNAFDAMRGGRFAVGELFAIHLTSLAAPLCYFALVLLLRIVLRKRWASQAGFVLVYMSLPMASFWTLARDDAKLTALLVGASIGLAIGVTLIVLLVRFGLLATAATFLCSGLLQNYPITTVVSAPYFASSLIGAVAALSYAAYGFWVARAGQPLLQDTILRDAVQPTQQA